MSHGAVTRGISLDAEPSTSVERWNQHQLSMLPTAIYRFNMTPIQMPVVFSSGLKKQCQNAQRNTRDPEERRQSLKTKAKWKALQFQPARQTAGQP